MLEDDDDISPVTDEVAEDDNKNLNNHSQKMQRRPLDDNKADPYLSQAKRVLTLYCQKSKFV